jgi:hypothetical protein
VNKQFQALSLDREDARAAYPFVLLHDASITLEKWLGFVRRRGRTTTSGRTGLIAIRHWRGIIYAMSSYRVDIDRRARKRFCIGNRIIAHMPGSRVDEAVTACMGRAQPGLAATPSASNSRCLRELMRCWGVRPRGCCGTGRDPPSAPGAARFLGRRLIQISAPAL